MGFTRGVGFRRLGRFETGLCRSVTCIRERCRDDRVGARRNKVSIIGVERDDNLRLKFWSR